MTTTNLNELKNIKPKEQNIKPKDQMKNLLIQNKDFIGDLLPKHMSHERLLRIAISMYTNVPKLAECWVPSVLGAVVHCASIGLEPNTPLGHAFIVPFRNNKTGRLEAQVIHGYKGLIDLMYRSGNIKDINASVVRAGDPFEYEYGINHTLKHRPTGGNNGAITHFYAYFHTVNGGFQFVVMDKSEVDSIKGKVPGGGTSGPWKDFYVPMGKKTAIRQLSNYAQLSIETNRALALDAMADIGDSQNIASTLKGGYTFEGDFEEDETPPPIETKPARKKRAKTTAKPKEEAPHNEEDTEGDDDQTGNNPLNFEAWSEYLEKAAGADDLDLVEDMIRNMKVQVQGLATDLLKKKRAELKPEGSELE